LSQNSFDHDKSLDQWSNSESSISSSCQESSPEAVSPVSSSSNEDQILQLSDAESKQIASDFIEKNSSLMWCPAKCGNAVKLNDESVKAVSCTCGKEFCVSCLEDSHEPLTCQQLQMAFFGPFNHSDYLNIFANDKFETQEQIDGVLIFNQCSRTILVAKEAFALYKFSSLLLITEAMNDLEKTLVDLQGALGKSVKDIKNEASTISLLAKSRRNVLIGHMKDEIAKGLKPNQVPPKMISDYEYAVSASYYSREEEDEPEKKKTKTNHTAEID